MSLNSRAVMGLSLAAVVACLFMAAPSAMAQATTATPPVSTEKIDGVYGYHLPPDISTHGHKMDSLINILHWFMGALFVGWGVFFVYCLVNFRQRPGHAAKYEPIKAKPSKYTEIAVVAFEAFLLLGLSIPIWASVKQSPVTNETGALRIRVVAEQFAWNFHYPGPDGQFGLTSPDLVNLATNPVGYDKAGNGADDVVSGEMHIPENRDVIVEISSKDVIHSFAIPVLRVKQDAIPGMRIPVWFKAKEKSEGRYQVACAQLCGNNHYKMLAPMVVESQQKFDAWIAEKSKPPEIFEGE